MITNARRLVPVAVCLACLALAAGLAHARPAAGRQRPQAQPAITLQFPTFTVHATTLTFEPRSVQLTSPPSSGVIRLINLESTRAVTPTVFIRIGSTPTFTLFDVAVASVQALTGGVAPNFEVTLTYKSTKPAA